MGSIHYGGDKVKKIFYGSNKVKKVYYGTQLVWTSAIKQDQGMSMRTCSFTCGSGAHNPLSGGSSNDWTVSFAFTWWGSKGGCFLYHNWNNRESTIRLLDDGRIQVWAARYDTGNNKTWTSTIACEKGKFNIFAVNRNGQIYINGQNATPGTYGGDMPMWGEFKLFPDRDIEGIVMGLQGWNWNLSPNEAWVTGRDMPYETDGSNWAMSFNGNLAYRLNSLSGAQKDIVGSPSYETWEWNEDREADKVN